MKQIMESRNIFTHVLATGFQQEYTGSSAENDDLFQQMLLEQLDIHMQIYEL